MADTLDPVAEGMIVPMNDYDTLREFVARSAPDVLAAFDRDHAQHALTSHLERRGEPLVGRAGWLVLEWLGFAATLLSLYLVGVPQPVAQAWTSLVSAVLWIVIGARRRAWSLLALNVCLLAIGAVNLAHALAAPGVVQP